MIIDLKSIDEDAINKKLAKINTSIKELKVFGSLETLGIVALTAIGSFTARDAINNGLDPSSLVVIINSFLVDGATISSLVNIGYNLSDLKEDRETLTNEVKTRKLTKENHK